MIMSKINEYIKNTSDYVSQILGEQLHFAPIAKDIYDKLPATISGAYTMYCTTFRDLTLIFAFSKNDSDFTPGQLKKHINLMERTTSAVVVFVFRKLVAYNRNRMIAGKVNFIIPNQQMYIPELFVDLRKSKMIDDDLSEKIPNIAQCILLYHLQEGSINGKTIQDVVNLFKTSYATADRAVRWLESKKIISIGMSPNREKVIGLNNDKPAVWEKALPFLTSPIEKVVYTDEEYPMCLESGVNALSEYTMINRERSFTYAISKNEYRQNKYQTDKQYGDNTIEIWRYDPHLFAMGKTVDKLSLYLSLRDSQDERIQIELEHLISEIKW